MKVLLVLFSIVKLVLGDVEAPYPPSGYRPSGPPFNLPEKPSRNFAPQPTTNTFLPNGELDTSNPHQKVHERFGLAGDVRENQIGTPQDSYAPPSQNQPQFWAQPHDQYGPPARSRLVPQYPPLNEPQQQYPSTVETSTPATDDQLTTDQEPFSAPPGDSPPQTQFNPQQPPPQGRSQSPPPQDRFQQPPGQFEATPSSTPQPRNQYQFPPPQQNQLLPSARFAPQPQNNYAPPPISQYNPRPPYQPHNQYGPPTTSPSSFQTTDSEPESRSPSTLQPDDLREGFESSTDNVEQFNQDFSRQQQFQRFNANNGRTPNVDGKAPGGNRYEQIEREQLEGLQNGGNANFAADSNNGSNGYARGGGAGDGAEPKRRYSRNYRRRRTQVADQSRYDAVDGNDEESAKIAIATAAVRPNSFQRAVSRFNRNIE